MSAAEEHDWWRDLRWPHAFVIAAVIVALAAVSFAPNAGCSVQIEDDTPTEVDR